jgi:hypothetical protein
MKLPVLAGVIRRRILVNYRVAPEVLAPLLPAGMRPRLVRGQALAGICLIRLEQIRPRVLPAAIGICSENAAHRFAVAWDDESGVVRQGVFISRRDTGCRWNHWAGGRLFPGEHQLARFDVCDAEGGVTLRLRSKDQRVSVDLEGCLSHDWPKESVFGSLQEASAFYEAGSLGYSVTSDPNFLDGLNLQVGRWQASPFTVRHVASSYFDEPARFPPGRIAFDHALIMRDVEHEWHAAPDYCCRPLQGLAHRLTSRPLALAPGRCA